MTEIFQSTNEIKDAIKSSLDEQFEQYGYDIVDAQVTDPQPSAKVKEAFDDVIASQQRKAAAENDAEALKIKMVGSANAEAKSVEIKTETFKRQRTAIAETIKGLVEDLKPTGVSADRALSYLEGIDYRDTIRDASVNPGTTILLPMNMTDVAKATAINEALKN